MLKGVKNKKEVVSWAFFDFANSSYAIIVISLLFSVYFRNVIAGGGPNADLIWGAVLSASILLSGLAAPFIGAMADFAAKRKPAFIVFSLIAIAGTAMLYFVGPGALLYSSIVFIITNFFYEEAAILYDAFLVLISKPKTAGTISGFGWGLGYVGGMIAGLILLPLYINGYEANDALFRLAFPLTALFFLIFSLPAFIWLKDHGQKAKSTEFIVKYGFKRVFHTLRHIREYKNVFRYFIGYYLLHDGLFTLIAFTGIFAVTTLNLSLANVFFLFLLIHVVGFISTPIAGKLADRWGKKKVLLGTIVGWAIATVWMAFITQVWQFWTLAVLGGLVIGSSQAVGRSLLSVIVPLKQSAELFGFNGFASKLAATLGPLLFGIISFLTGNQRYAVLSLLVFFVASFIVLWFVKEERTKAVKEHVIT